MSLGHFHVNPSEEVQRPTWKVIVISLILNPVCFDCEPKSHWVLTEDVLPALSAPVPVQRSSQKSWSMWQSTWEIWSSAYGRKWRLLLNTVSLMNQWFHEEPLTMESFHFFFCYQQFFIFIFLQTTQHNIQNKNKTADTYSTSKSSIKREGEREGQQEHKSHSFK